MVLVNVPTACGVKRIVAVPPSVEFTVVDVRKDPPFDTINAVLLAVSVGLLT